MSLFRPLCPPGTLCPYLHRGSVRRKICTALPGASAAIALADASASCSTFFCKGKLMPHDQMKSCIDACNECAVACDHCAASCLQEPDVKAMARCIALDVDCAELCRLAAAYMARGSELAGAICEVCADVCEACGKECERHSKMDHCRQCAEACRRCAEECRRMASTHPRRGGANRGAGLSAH